jgi:FAD:protein FMN transferase
MERLRLQQSADGMGTTFSIILYGDEREAMEAAVAAAFDEARRLDELLSNYRPDSEWNSVNREAARDPVHVSAELFAILSDCERFSRLTEGAFDITVGPLKKAWGFYRGNGRIPEPEELAAASRKVGYRHVHLDPANLTVEFALEGMEIDPGGIGKGYAVDRMVDILREWGFDTALVAGSGSSLYGLGSPPSETQGWRADVRHPEHSRKTLAHRHLRNLALSTSGTGEKFFWSEEGTFSHIVDPRTGRALQDIFQVSVVCPTAVEGEVWAKAFLINGREWAAQHKPEGFQVLFSSDGPPEWFS